MINFKTIAALSLGALLLVGCNYEESSTRTGTRIQEQNMKNAVKSLPVPQVRQFTTRKSIVRWVEAANEPDQTHYVYVMLPGVGYVGYYVADSAPVNICTSLTPPVRPYPRSGSSGHPPLGPAPALDGVYYGGAGCDKWYFFDASSGAKIEVGGQMAFFVSSLPLVIDTPRLEVRAKTE